MKAKIDAILNSWISKKLMVLIIATILASFARLDSAEWANIAIMYIGTQGAIDAIKQLRGKQED
tara:strand:+ start:2502 stop:2693 length:192 start_codon:yes stop_codon:yes gene_type:complete